MIFNTISFVLSEFSNVSRAIRSEQLFSVVMFSSTALKILSNRSDVLLIACDYKTQKLTYNRNMCKKCGSLACIWPFIITGCMNSIRKLISFVNNNIIIIIIIINIILNLSSVKNICMYTHTHTS